MWLSTLTIAFTCCIQSSQHFFFVCDEFFCFIYLNKKNEIRYGSTWFLLELGVCLAYRGTQIECLHYIIRSKRNNVNVVGTRLDVSLCNHETGPDDDSVIDEFPFIYLYFVIFCFLWSLLLLLLLSCRCRFSCTLSMRSSQDFWSELLRKSNNNNKCRVGLLHLTTFCVRKLICVIRF